MEDWHIIVNIVSLIINVSLVYFAVRLLWIFRGGIMGRPWRFIASGVLALAVSSTIFFASLSLKPWFRRSCDWRFDNDDWRIATIDWNVSSIQELGGSLLTS